MRPTLIWLLTVILASARLSAAGVTLELTNGSKLVGTIIKEENGKIHFRADLVGDVVIDAAAITRRSGTEALAGPPPSIAPPPVPVVPATAAAPVTPKAHGEKVMWKRSLSISGSFNSASYEQGTIPGWPATLPARTGAQAGLQGKQSTMQVTGTLVRMTPHNAFTLQGTYGHARFEPAGTVMNNHSAEGTYTQVFAPKWYWLTRATYKVDKISLIDHAFEQVLGVGHKVIDNKGTTLDLIPGISLVNDRKGTRWDDEWVTSVGVLENFEHPFSPTVSLQQRFKYRVGVNDSEVWAITAHLGLVSQITTHTSFNVGITYTNDNTLGPLPATLARSFVRIGLPPAVVDQLRPGNQERWMLTSGLGFNW
ncbi:MAG: DUF481 domain-containing protein [Verrucomicrobia bacterium]|nr:DUF481 domain-containing protein [Verrucomicrobiota bacterium]